jgi:hypothetical protein
VEADFALGGFRLEVWCNIVDRQSHELPPSPAHRVG